MRNTGGKRAAVGIAALALGLAAVAPIGAAAQSAAPSTAPAPVVTPEPAKDCARSTAENAMQMWERSGGNKGMVDQLV